MPKEAYSAAANETYEDIRSDAWLISMKTGKEEQ